MTAKRFYRERESTCFEEHHWPAIGDWHGVQGRVQLGKNRLRGHTDESSNRRGRLFEPRTWGRPPFELRAAPDKPTTTRTELPKREVRSSRRSKMAARGEPLSSLLPVRADYLTRRRRSGSRHHFPCASHSHFWEDCLAQIGSKPLCLLVPGERFELPTNGLQNRCSTAELTRQINDLQDRS